MNFSLQKWTKCDYIIFCASPDFVCQRVAMSNNIRCNISSNYASLNAFFGTGAQDFVFSMLRLATTVASHFLFIVAGNFMRSHKLRVDIYLDAAFKDNSTI